MSTEIVQVAKERVVIALGRLRLGIRDNEELMRQIGASMLVSVRRTFREQGSPDGSWAPLSPNTIKRDPKRYGAGHKLLIGSGRLLNSITFAAFTGGVTIGTNVIYARVHQYGSADRSGAAIGPQARIEGRSVSVEAHTRGRRNKAGDKFGVVDRHTYDGFKIVGRRRKLVSGVSFEGVRSHQRFQNIPARPYMVFRPEDPARIRKLVVQYVNKVRDNAGLRPGGAS
jgi:phage virion morphogenesis protein